MPSRGGDRAAAWTTAYRPSAEAALVRRALDAALAGDAATLLHPGRAHAAERLVATLDRIARTGAVAPGAYDREELYAERMSALDRRRP